MYQLSPADMAERKFYRWSYQLQKKIKNSDLPLCPIDPQLYVQHTCVTHFYKIF